MKILHYALGFPPYRTGGLTKYCVDLMIAQKKSGHDVAMMWPGAFSFSGHFVRFKKSKKLVKDGNTDVEIKSFEVINPLPVPLDEGITDIESYMSACPNPEVYEVFFKEYLPDVIHVHTLMGLHKEFFETARKLDIRIVFTSHDYFGICPKVTLFRNGRICDGDCSSCAECNEGALSLKKIAILQSSLYRNLKDSAPVRALRKRHRQSFFEENETVSAVEKSNIIKKDDQSAEYEKLRKYYVDMLEMVNIIHFNSSVTESVYRRFIPEKISRTIVNITHKNIGDHRKYKEFKEKLKITYLAAAKPFKGFTILREALDEVYEHNPNFVLNVYNSVSCTNPYMNVNERFEYYELEKIFNNTDVLIAPSVWYETFGFTVLEALSYGVPVIVSENVGAKDLLENGKYGAIIRPTKEAIKEVIEKMLGDREILKRYNRAIVEEMDLEKVITSEKEIEKMYET